MTDGPEPEEGLAQVRQAKPGYSVLNVKRRDARLHMVILKRIR